MTVSAPHGWAGPRQIQVRDQVHAFEPGETLSFSCHLEEGWRPRFEPPKRSKHDVDLAATRPQAEAGPST